MDYQQRHYITPTTCQRNTEEQVLDIIAEDLFRGTQNIAQQLTLSQENFSESEYLYATTKTMH
ncbi:hypothetical protein HUJ05_009946 [Dendroctonus ponderosae]|nr:hypothetical protein HUJ05_009946 [Dendroctonus ponderosae]